MLRSIALRLMSSFLVIIVIISAVFSYVGIRFVRDRVVAEAQRRVAESMNAAREIYSEDLRSVQQVVRLTAEGVFLRQALRSGRPDRVAALLADVRRREQLDVLAITDAQGMVVVRPGEPGRVGDGRGDDPLVRAVLQQRQSVAGTQIVSATGLRRESPALEERARIRLVETPRARARTDTEETAGMMLAAAAPIRDDAGTLIGVAYGGSLLNRRFGLPDKIKEVVFENALYRGKVVGTATVFMGDVRIATNVLNADGTRAVGTRASADVYEQVVARGRPFFGRAFVVNDSYIAAYEPIRAVDSSIVGMLYVGTLEAPYTDLQRRSTLVFLGITAGGAVLTIGLSWVLSRRFSVPLRQLVLASRRLARGDLDAKVETPPVGEFAELAESFNAMAAALRKRDEKLHEFARKKIMESERLAIVGQLAADVAHELNNPLQGIVTYSHLLRERFGPDDSARAWVEKIVIQADRSTKIIRALLDFSRPRKPLKKPTKVSALLEECISLVENQALFHNIAVVKQFGADIPDVVIDPSLMQQVFMNLIINAAEAMDGIGRLALTTCYDPIAEMVEVGFVDTGHGIKPEDVDRIFEPFFTTKEVGHGTGLGLAISSGIVKEHHGAISVESEIGKGTSFIVSLPLHDSGEGQA